MDLDEYLFYQKKKDSTFKEKDFAKKLDLSQHQLWNIKKKNIAPSSKSVYLIEKLTNGEVDTMQMIRDFYKKKGL